MRRSTEQLFDPLPVEKVNNANHDRIHPSPYVYPVTLRSDLPEMLTGFVTAELVKRDDNNVLRALGQLHEVRFETPYFTSLGNDIEALWTAFESFWLSRPASPSSVASRPALAKLRRILTPIRRLASGVIRAFVPKRFPSRAERLAAAICDELRAVSSVRPETLAGIGVFAEKLWFARNAHSHAGHAEPEIDLDQFKSTVLSVGLLFFEYLLKVRIALSAGDDIFLLPTAVDALNEVFLREQTIRGMVDRLSKAIPADWYPSGPENNGQYGVPVSEVDTFVASNWVSESGRTALG